MPPTLDTSEILTRLLKAGEGGGQVCILIELEKCFRCVRFMLRYCVGIVILDHLSL